MDTQMQAVEPAVGGSDQESAVGGSDQESYARFRAELLSAGLLIDTGVDGLYGKSAVYESVVQALDRLITARMVDRPAEVLSFPPVMARWVFDKTDYLKSFPDLMGSVHTFRGTDRQHRELISLAESGGDWPSALVPAEVVLCSATCHVIYPLCTGTLPDGGRRFEVNGYCFRCEPSIDPSRMQAFRMHEYVYVGDPDDAQKHRDGGLERGLELLAQLGLDVEAIPANDPFFGRLGTMLAANQLDEALKMEIVTPVCSTERPTAIMSANCHRDHFGVPFDIADASGSTAHSACVAFGVDRVTLALLKAHGLDPAGWPAVVRRLLWA
jgi:seryl-tRNA synthetase